MKLVSQVLKKTNDNLILIGVVFIVSTFVFLDLYLSFMVTTFPRGTSLPISTNNTGSSCFVSPFCYINVKSLLLDPPNFYIHSPLSSFIVIKLDLANSYQFISANAISFTHVPIAFIASRLISRENIFDRRIGVLLFELRNFLDALDGGVARARKKNLSPQHPVVKLKENLNTNLEMDQLLKKVEKSQVSKISKPFKNHLHSSTNQEQQRNPNASSNLGFYIDGICDGIGCIFLYLACFAYLRKHPIRSFVSYSPLPVVIFSNSSVSLIDANDCDKESNTRNYKIIKNGVGSKAFILRQIIRSVQQSGITAFLFGFQTLFGSIFWNRYIANYSKLLEFSNNDGRQDLSRNSKSGLLYSPIMWLVIFTWRYVNPHAWLEILLVAIFLDKMGELLNLFQYLGFFVIFLATFFTEIHLYDVENVFQREN